MLQNKIYQNYLIDIFKTFLTILLGFTLIAWTVRAVNFLDLIVESGYPVLTYFQYSFLNIFGILTKFIPLSFLIALILFIIKQIQENELIILWTSGVKKIELVKLFFLFSLIISIFYLVFSSLITPLALNKSRQILGKESLTSFLPTVKAQQFSDSFNGVTFIVDKKYNNELKNIFLQDSAKVLKNISSNKKKALTTIIASNGIINENKMIMFKGQIISSDKNNQGNDIIKFDQLSVDLNNFKNRTIKQPKVQETSTITLLTCLEGSIFYKISCENNFKTEILPILNRRITFPLYFPIIALFASFLLIKSKKKFFFSKVSVFLYCFLVLLYAELIIRYTGISSLISKLFILSPVVLSILVYIFLKFKFSNEALKNE